MTLTAFSFDLYVSVITIPSAWAGAEQGVCHG